MRLGQSRGLIAVAAAAAILAACSKPEPIVVVEAPPPPPPPPVALNQGVADAASIYVSFIRDVSTIPAGGFQDAESIQSAMRRGAAYDPATLSRGMIAYGSILALQSPEFVQGVRTYAVDPAVRAELVANISRDPAYAATLPGAEAAAGLIVATLNQDITALTAIAEGVENDAYTIQGRRDPRRRWAIQPIADRESRLESIKTLSAGQMLPSAEDSARLFAAANSGAGLSPSGSATVAPYTPAVVHSLAIAALAALGAGGDDARGSTEALSIEANAQFCLDMSKLNLFQCLAASRPSYEDMFCIGRHIVRDLATCTTEAITPRTLAPSPDTMIAQVTPVAAEATTAALQATEPSPNR
ncbi:hypothetical protein IP78_11225 [Brevundimonas sp. AAP58]|uniref:hypothetical protein n=1 Tax=Brevundimonas sp. AAP58 TaxID=1523422 RepID=UPI0006B9BE56|nr:hypothetical protein [Brevundimonas sp. AAP58]KPF78417.1 hypothetical protein IP78_11225 [Brevundimonas sp. AAP58]